MTGVTFNPEISLGAVISIGMVAAAIIGGWYKFGGRLDMIEYRVKAVEDTMTKIGEVLKTIAETNTKLAVMDQRHLACEESVAVLQKELSSLRRGEGWIRSHRESVNGEYS